MYIHKKNDVHVLYGKQQYTRNEIISLYYYLPIIQSLPDPDPAPNTYTHTHHPALARMPTNLFM